ncbi:nucleophile aminohydrolase [Lipomyces japonicus]|uniref:nucleophile aminohydrolase n=1 Tax=Lipomyces japonicus TaxID=56871 RepID=UPI0034CD481F
MPFIAVHLGAGSHSSRLEKSYNKLCRKACDGGLKLLNDGATAATAAATACSILEQSDLTNAGIGSNIASNGDVECDASIIETSRGRGAAVGCITNTRFPIQVAGRLLAKSFDNLSHGRVAPLFLVGQGARKFASEQNIETIPSSEMKTEQSVRQYNRWSKIINQAGSETISETDLDAVNDTVGVICVDLKGEIAVASSSGGVAMKHPGRIGPAALIGTGIWATSCHDMKLGVCTTGTGEDIISTGLAFKTVDTLVHADDEFGMLENFLNQLNQSKAMQSQPPSVGVLAIKTVKQQNNTCSILLIFGHTTRSMCLAYKSDDTKSLEFVLSKSANLDGQPVIGGVMKRIHVG